MLCPAQWLAGLCGDFGSGGILTPAGKKGLPGTSNLGSLHTGMAHNGAWFKVQWFTVQRLPIFIANFPTVPPKADPPLEENLLYVNR